AHVRVDERAMFAQKAFEYPRVIGGCREALPPRRECGIAARDAGVEHDDGTGSDELKPRVREREARQLAIDRERCEGLVPHGPDGRNRSRIREHVDGGATTWLPLRAVHAVLAFDAHGARARAHTRLERVIQETRRAG